jgi:hypothetical protein
MPIRLAALFVWVVSACFSQDWNTRLAEHYMDSRQQEWVKWPVAMHSGVAHQDAQNGNWAADSMNHKHQAGELPEKFMSDAATGYATEALLAASDAGVQQTASAAKPRDLTFRSLRQNDDTGIGNVVV